MKLNKKGGGELADVLAVFILLAIIFAPFVGRIIYRGEECERIDGIYYCKENGAYVPVLKINHSLYRINYCSMINISQGGINETSN